MEMVSQLTEHHDLSPSEVSREHSAVNKIKATILDHGNPFAVEGVRLQTIITHAYVPEMSSWHIYLTNNMIFCWRPINVTF